MLLSERINLGMDQILLDMKALDKWSAIGQLLDVLIKTGQVNPADREAIYEALTVRENSVTTGIGYQVALPHTYSDRIKRVVSAFGRSVDGIDFESVDKMPVNLVLLYLVPKDLMASHLKQLARIARFFKVKANREALLKAPDREKVLRCFQVDLAD